MEAQFGNFPSECLHVTLSYQPSSCRALSAESSCTPRSHSLGRRSAGPSRRPAPGWWLWWHRWLCARPSPEGLGPVAAQAGPAEAGVGRLGLGEDGRGEPRRKQPGRQDPGLRPVGRCHLQVSQPGASRAPRPLSDPEVLLAFELSCRREH